MLTDLQTGRRPLVKKLKAYYNLTQNITYRTLRYNIVIKYIKIYIVLRRNLGNSMPFVNICVKYK